MTTETKKTDNVPLLIRMLINVLSKIPVFDKEMLMEMARKASWRSIYVGITFVSIAASPLFFAFVFPTSVYVRHNNIRNLINEFVRDHMVLYYAIFSVVAAEIILAIMIFKKGNNLYRTIVIVVGVVQLFFIGRFCVVAAKEAKYLCGPIHSHKLYKPHELFVSGKYDDALTEDSSLKKSKQWHHLAYEINEMENMVLAAKSYGPALEKRILDVAGQKNYLQLLDMLVFQRKIDPGNTSTISYTDAIQTEYKKAIKNLVNGANVTGGTFSDDEIILRRFLSHKPLGVMKYDSLLLVTAFSSRPKIDAIKYMMNDTLITKWIDEARYKP